MKHLDPVLLGEEVLKKIFETPKNVSSADAKVNTPFSKSISTSVHLSNGLLSFPFLRSSSELSQCSVEYLETSLWY
jgi:hypothetical protein